MVVIWFVLNISFFLSWIKDADNANAISSGRVILVKAALLKYCSLNSQQKKFTRYFAFGIQPFLFQFVQRFGFSLWSRISSRWEKHCAKSLYLTFIQKLVITYPVCKIFMYLGTIAWGFSFLSFCVKYSFNFIFNWWHIKEALCNFYLNIMYM